MVNVTNAETQFIESFVDYANSGITQGYHGFDAIPNSVRPRFLQDQGFHDLVSISDNLLESIARELNVPTSSLRFTASRDNRVGSDLLEVNTQVSIELKLGLATDVNVGFGSIVKYLFPNEIDLFPTRDDRVRWRSLYRKEGPTSVLSEQKQKFTVLQSILQSRYTDHILGENASKLITGYAYGVTNEKEIFRTQDNHYRKILRFDLTLGHGWKFQEKTALENSEWLYGDFNYSMRNRFTFFIKNTEFSKRLNLVLNYKNNYKFPDGVKVEAKLGLGSPSFNGWWV